MMRSELRLTIVTTLGVVVPSRRRSACRCVPCSAQRRRQQPTSQPVFRTGTRLIVQTVTVKDKDGKPIEGLTAKDFIVTEDGEPQDIAFVEFQRLHRGRRQPPTRRAGGRRAAAAAAGRRRADRSRRRRRRRSRRRRPGDIRYRDRRLLVLYFDLSAMPPADQMRAYTAALKFIDDADDAGGSGRDHDVSRAAPSA